MKTDKFIKALVSDLKNQVANCKKYNYNMDGSSWGYQEGVLITPNQASFIVEHMTRARFIKPTDKQLIDIAILFNDGKLDQEKLSDMVAMCEFVINRLNENNDVTKPSSFEK